MIRHLGHLPKLRAAIQSAPAVPSPTDVDGMIRAIERRARFAEMHLALILGIDWDNIERVGRRQSGAVAPAGMSVSIVDATLHFEHYGAIIDHVYLAFDGLIAALVNSTDTLGRLINATYNLGIRTRGATLHAVRDRCAPTSPLGVVLYDPTYMDWLKCVRDLRGRCQHADVDNILAVRAGPYSRRGEPEVDASYSWSVPPQTTSLIPYVQNATKAAEDCIIAIVDAIAGAAPGSPI